MPGLITRCPKCATAFNVTEAHLNTANGAVRCGSCLNVFNGRENLTNTLKRSPASTLLDDDDDDLLISDDLELDDHVDDEPEQDPVRERVQSILEKTKSDDDDLDDDESWALALLEEEGHNPSQLGLKKQQDKAEHAKAEARATGEIEPEPVAPDDSAINQSPTTKAVDDQEQTSVARSSVLDEADSPVEAEHVDREVSVADRFAQQTETQTETAPTSKETPVAKPEPEPTQAAQKAQEYAEAKAQEPEPEPEINEAAFDELRQELEASQPQEAETPRTLFDAIEVEAVELHVTSNKSRWLSRMIWSFLVIIAGTALAAQVAWLKFDEWSLQDPYRGYYAIACEHLGCTLPIRKDIRQIRTSNLLVREHPNKENALLVDVVIQNHASYEQPFPKLTLVFSNIKNKVVASRSFGPQEYLGGDLIGATLMPSLKAIHLSLDLEDPGKGAVSYKIKIEE